MAAVASSNIIHEKAHEGQIARWQQHIEALAGGIGPRGSTTPNERRAADYCARIYAGLGLTPSIETFRSATSGYLPHLYIAIGVLLAFVVYPLAGQASADAAAIISVLSVLSEVLEMLFKPNPARWLLPKSDSQNVVVSLPPAGDHRQDLILIGHLDTNRTPLIFSSTFWVDFWRITVPIMFASFCLQAALYITGAVTGWHWVWSVSIFSAASAVLLLLMTAQAGFTPYSAGANDNASGASMVLTLASYLTQNPLEHTRVWFVNTGCEEVKHYGAIDFFERHMSEFVNPHALVFEMLGRDGPAWLEHEYILPGFGYRPDPSMVELVQQLLEADSSLTCHPTRVTGGHTEMADALRMGIPALTFIGIGPAGTPLGYSGPPLYWHQRDDTPDKMDPVVMTRAFALADAFIRALDQQATHSHTHEAGGPIPLV